MSTDVRLDGVQRLTQTLHAAAAAIADTADLNRELGEQIIGVAVIPKGVTGELAAGATVDADALGFAAYSTSQHFTYVHWGTQSMRARPFFLDALADRADHVAAAYLEHATDVLDTIQGA